MVELRNLYLWEIGRLGGGIEVSTFFVYWFLGETCCLRVFIGEELCIGFKRGCILDCFFGFLIDVYNCEIC